MKWWNNSIEVVKDKFSIEFENWLEWVNIFFGRPSIYKWSLFEVVYDNGAFWGMGLGEPDENGTRTNPAVDCFLRITLFGIGFRWDWKREIKVQLPDMKTLLLMNELKEANKAHE